MLLQVFLSGIPHDGNLTVDTAAKNKNEDFQCLSTWKTRRGATRTEMNTDTRQVVISDDSQEYRDEIALGKQGSHLSMKAKCTWRRDPNMVESSTTRIGKRHEDVGINKESPLQANTVKEEQAHQSLFALKKNNASPLSYRRTWDSGNTVENSVPTNETYTVGKEEHDWKVGVFQTESKWTQSQKPRGMVEYETCGSQFADPVISKREGNFAKGTWQEATGNAGLTNKVNEPYSPSRFYCERNVEKPTATYNTTQSGSENERHET